MFFPNRYARSLCFLCNTNQEDTWMRVLKDCMHPHLHIIQRHKKGFWEIGRLIPFSIRSRCLINMNVGTLTPKGPYVHGVPKPDLGNVT
jgi:hypothetical protein